MATKATEATGKRSYEDFEPFCKWQEEEHNTLEVHLNGFQKDQLRVQIDNILGVLTISGSRPLNETKWSRFHKEIKISKDCKRNEIHAKFSRGILYVVMPKRSSQDQAITKTNSHDNKEKPNQAPMSPKESIARESNVAGASTSIGSDIENANGLSTGDNKITMKSLKKRVSRLIRVKPMIVGTAAVAVMVVFLGIYVMNKYQALDHVEN